MEIAQQIAPLFPLPNVFLFPGTAMPLHIFEPRYRQMIDDLLDGPGRLVMGTVLPGHEQEMGASPPVHPTAGLGEIVRHEKLPDGRYMILLFGLSRVHVREVDSDRLYRKVEATPIDETPVADGTEDEVREQLTEAVQSRLKTDLDFPDNLPLGQLTDLLLLSLKLPEAIMLKLYSQQSVADRARGALDEHATRPIQKSDVISDTIDPSQWPPQRVEDGDDEEEPPDFSR